MGSGGTEWEVADIISASRMNQKTNFVGTGAQIAALTTYAGMSAYCTTIGSGFTADQVYIRNAADSAWISQSVVGLQEIWIPAGAMSVSNLTNGAAFSETEKPTNDILVVSISFDASTSEKAQFWWTPPLNWDGGTIKFKLYHTNFSGLTTETIDFDLAAIAYADSDAIDAALGTAQNVTDTWLAQNDVHITAYSSAITIGGGPVAGEPILCQLSRDVTDTMTGDVEVIGIMLQFGLDAAVSE